MKLTPITLPRACCQRFSVEFVARLVGAGETALLGESLFGFIASRECPGRALLETVDLVPKWVKAGWVIVSGFHSPLEQQVLHSVLRRQGRVVKVLARGMASYRVPAKECEAFEAGRVLVITSFPPQVRRITRKTALERNELVLELASERWVPFAAPGSPLADVSVR